MNASLSPKQEISTQQNVEYLKGLSPVPSPRSNQKVHRIGPEGLLQVHTATYRGSFSNVFSEAIRAAGLGRRVLVAQFLKGGVDQGPQGKIQLCGKLEWIRPEIPTCLSNQANNEAADSIKAVKAVWDVCKENLLAGTLDQLVLDEIGLAISLGYLKEQELITNLELRPKTMDIILTGPSIPDGVMSMANQVTELRCSK